MTIKEFFSFRHNKFFWINIIAMVVAAFLLVFIVLKGLDIYTQHGESVAVPDVKGMTEKEAAMLLRNHGFEYQVSDSGYVKNVLPGSILDQNPSGGMKVKNGRVIYLTINSLHIPLRLVPDVADNSSLRQAQAKLTAAGFKLNAEEYVAGERDWVYGVKYNGRELGSGDKIPAGALLTILVGNGEKLPSVNEDSVNTNTEDPGQPVVTPSEHASENDSWF